MDYLLQRLNSTNFEQTCKVVSVMGCEIITGCNISSVLYFLTDRNGSVTEDSVHILYAPCTPEALEAYIKDRVGPFGCNTEEWNVVCACKALENPNFVVRILEGNRTTQVNMSDYRVSIVSMLAGFLKGIISDQRDLYGYENGLKCSIQNNDSNVSVSVNLIGKNGSVSESFDIYVYSPVLRRPYAEIDGKRVNVDSMFFERIKEVKRNWLSTHSFLTFECVNNIKSNYIPYISIG